MTYTWNGFWIGGSSRLHIIPWTQMMTSSASISPLSWVPSFHFWLLFISMGLQMFLMLSVLKILISNWMPCFDAHTLKKLHNWLRYWFLEFLATIHPSSQTPASHISKCNVKGCAQYFTYMHHQNHSTDPLWGLVVKTVIIVGICDEEFYLFLSWSLGDAWISCFAM